MGHPVMLDTFENIGLSGFGANEKRVLHCGNSFNEDEESAQIPAEIMNVVKISKYVILFFFKIFHHHLIYY